MTAVVRASFLLFVFDNGNEDNVGWDRGDGGGQSQVFIVHFWFWPGLSCQKVLSFLVLILLPIYDNAFFLLI